MTAQRVKIKDLPWMGLFRFSPDGPVGKKTALLKTGKVGYMNSAEDIFYTNENRRVIPVIET